MKEAGSAFETAFSDALKPGNDLIDVFTKLAEQIAEITLKATLLRPFERALDTYFAGPSAASLAPGAASALLPPPPQLAAPSQPDISQFITTGIEDAGSAFTTIVGDAFKDNQSQVTSTFGTAFTSNQGLLNTIFGGIISGLLGLFTGGGGSGIADSLGGLTGGLPIPGLTSSRIASTSIGNPAAPNFFRAPEVRSAAPTQIHNTHIHGADPSQTRVEKRKNDTGGMDIDVYLDQAMAKRVQSGRQFEKSQRVVSGVRRQAIER